MKLKEILFFITYLTFSNINIIHAQPNTPLHDAVRKSNHTQLKDFLIKGAPINALDENGNTALHLAAYYGKEPAIDILLSYPDVNVFLENYYGQTALDFACRNNYPLLAKKIQQYILSKNLKNNLKNNLEFKTLIQAVFYNNIPTIKKIINNQPSLLNQTNYYGNTPLHIATYYANKEAVKTLLSYPHININIKNSNKNLTPEELVLAKIKIPLLDEQEKQKYITISKIIAQFKKPQSFKNNNQNNNPNIKNNKTTSEIIDIAIVGAGASGLYAGYRLKNHYKDKKIVIFESDNRVGGRIWAHSVINYAAIKDSKKPILLDLGAARYEKSHKNIDGLSRILGLKKIAFKTSGTHNINYLRGFQLKATDYKSKPYIVPYFLNKDEYGKSPGELLEQAILKEFPILEDLKNTKNFDWNKFIKSTYVDNKPLYKWGFWNLLSRRLSSEAYKLVKNGVGYDSIFTNWNAADAVHEIMANFGTTPEYFTFKTGMGSIAPYLAKEFTNSGGLIKLKNQLTSLELSNTELNNNNQEYIIKLKIFDIEQQKEITYKARNVILALPRRSLELLDHNSFIFKSENFNQNLRTVTPNPMGRIYFQYDSPWWQKLNIYEGQSITDLPVRQCYYSHEKENNTNLLMASYHDGNSINYWQGYLPYSRYSPAPFKPNEKVISTIEPSSDFTKEVHRQLELMHNTKIPAPVFSIYQDWSKDPFGGAWHSWNPHNKSWELIEYMRQPFKSIPLYTCGEAYSYRQAWVEGALNSAEKLLQEKFNLPRVNWIPKDYDLGP